MKYPKIIEEISRHQWAITDAAMDGILRALDGGIDENDTPIFHGAKEHIAAELGPEPPPKGKYRYGQKIGKVGCIRVEGPIAPRADWLTEASGITSSELVGKDLAAMEVDEGIEKIVMVFDTPGGAVAGTSELAAQIKKVEKPVVAYVFGMSASAGYWLASAADEIVSADTGIVGSIGTIMTIWNDKADDTVTIVSSQSPLKNVDPESKKGQAHYQKLVDSLSNVFINTVAENRGITPEQVVKKYGRGGVYAASDALKMGMIDRISTFADFMVDLQAVEPTPEPDNKTDTKPVDNISKIGGNDLNRTPPRADENDERDRSMDKTLKEFLAENPSAFSDHQAILATTREKAQEDLRVEMALAAKVCASEDYPNSVRAIAVEVINGKRTMAALDGAMAASEITKEGAAAAKAAKTTADLPDTAAGDKTATSKDGVIATMADLEASLPKKVKV